MSSSNDKPRKRVILKVWQHEGVVLDNAHEIEWLERQGWKVECSEKLLDDPAGISHVLYVLEWEGPTPAEDSAETDATVAPECPAADKTCKIPYPKPTARILLALHATRGRIVVQHLYPWGPPPVVMAPSPASPYPGSIAGFVPVEPAINAGSSRRQVAVMCVNDAAYAPHPGDLPDGEAAVMTAHAYFIRTDDTMPQNPDPKLLFKHPVQPGHVATFYLEFEREA